MKKIAILTGKRGGFGAMMGLMKLIEQDPDLSSELIVTDMHLSLEFGNTVEEVEKWFKVSHKIDLEQKDGSQKERAQVLGRCLAKMAQILEDIKPDLLLTLGDRGEVLSACIAALELNIPIAHILGGDVSGNRDGIRIHAITKLAHLHFPSCQASANRIISLGEEPWRIHNVGATYVDYIVQGKFTPNNIVRKKYNLEDKKYALFIQHPITLQEQESYEETKVILTALKNKLINTIIIYPCSDQGYEGVLRAIDEYREVDFFQVHKNIEAVDFWGLQSGASFMIGNSSSGLIEAPYFNLPAINVGDRQKGRVKDSNVIDTKADIKELESSIDKALSKDFLFRIRNNKIFGDGYASQKIIKILKETTFDNNFLRKEITY